MRKFVLKSGIFLKNWPIEVYGLVLFLLLTLLVFLPLSGEGLSFFQNHARSVVYYFVFGGPYFLGAFVFLNLYFAFKLLNYLGQMLIEKDFAQRNVFYEKIRRLIKGHLHLGLVAAIGLIIMGIFVSHISAIKNYSLITSSSDLFMKWDSLIFGSYPFFWLNKMASGNLWGEIFLISYKTLGLALGGTLILLLAFNKKLARRFLVFFFTAFLVSLPIYFIFPALSPYNMYVRNLLNVEQSPGIKFEVDNFQPSRELKSYSSSIDQAGAKAKGGLDLTSMPSMHVAWGFGLVIFLIELWPILGTVAIPWFVFQMLGTAYTGQHYGVDAFGGIGVALIALFLTKLVFRFEEKYRRGAEFLPMADFIHEDLERFLQTTGRFVRRLKSFSKV